MLSLTEVNGMVNISFLINVPKKYVEGTHQYLFTPVLTDFNNTLPLTSVVIDGKKYAKMVAKGGHSKYMSNKMEMSDYMDNAIQLLGTKNERVIKYELTIPYEQWMENANLIIIERFNSRNNTVLIAEDVYAKGIKQTSPKVVLKPVIVKKEIEGDIKINFPIGSSKIDMKLDDNLSELQALHKVLWDIMSNKDNVIDSVVIIASSSPDGSNAQNEILATAPAMSIKHYLIKNKELSPEMKEKVKVHAIAENWKGLKELVRASDISNKEQVMKTLSISNLDKREQAMMWLPQYGYIKKYLLPQLRFVKYRICYHNMTMEEVPVVIIPKERMTPQQMQNQMNSVNHSEHHHRHGKDRMVIKDKMKRGREKKEYKNKMDPRYIRYNR